MARGRRPIVVKLGGSQAFSAHLRAWLDALAQAGGQVVVVPGGGPFADAVRTAQPAMGFDDRAAHDMAILAMEQYGRALASLDRRLVPAASLASVRRVLRDGAVPVWAPSRMASAAQDLPPSWDVTSDSMAAWLAGRLRAPRLVLVKPVAIAGDGVPAASLVAQGIVDKAFAHYLAASGAAGFIAGPADHAGLARLLDGGGIGTRIL
jgi:dihydroneopterin aldolase